MHSEVGDAHRIGVFLCECGGEISSAVDLPKLRTAIGALGWKPHVNVGRYWCSGSGLKLFERVVQEQGLDAVIVAGCSARTHGALMACAAERVGVNRNRTVLVNLREHCARVHVGKRGAATVKALRLVLVGIERASTAKPLEPISSEVERSAVVIGGGVAGMTAARALASRNIPVVLIEREQKLGGILRNVNRLYPSYCDAASYVREMSERTRGHPRIDVQTGSRALSVSGHVGRYVVTAETASGRHELTAGCVVLATGSDVLVPDGYFGYGTNPKVVSQLEFEAMLREGLEGVKRLVMIQCVGSRNEERPYCSRVCCTATVKNTMTVLEDIPGAEITVLSRGFAQYVGDLDRARDAGVSFLRYDPDRPPAVGPDAVEVFDLISSTEMRIPYDIVVLATPLVPRADTADLAKLVSLPIDEYGFLAEPHTRLRPGAFPPAGVFVAGSVHWPASVIECQSQAHSAASRAAAVLEQDSVERDPIVAVVDELTCRGCGRCEEVCVHGAPLLSEQDDGMRVTAIDAMLCKGCGVCVSVCPSSALSLEHLTPQQLTAMVRAAAGA